MPLAGYVCPPGGEEPGRQNKVEYCLTDCKQFCTTPPLLAAMYKADTGNYHAGDYISASMLSGSGCNRQVFFERYEPFYEVPTRRYWAFRGTHAHTIVEGAQDLIAKYGWLQEIRMSTELPYAMAAPVFDDDGNWTGDFDSTKDLIVNLRGTCDALLALPGRSILVDCKSFADFKSDAFVKGTMKGSTISAHLSDSWVCQLNIYAWLIGRTPIPDWVHAQYEEHGLPRLEGPNFQSPTELFIQGISMMNSPVSGRRVALKKYGKYTMHDIDAVPVWSAQETEDFIRPRALEWYRALKLKQKPPIVTPDKDWLCGVCAFRGQLCNPEQERAAT